MSQLDSTSQELPATGMEKFFEDNARKLGWLFIIAVVAACVGGLIMHNNRLKAEEAAEAFTSARTLENCDHVISSYPGTQAAANALLLKSDLLWDQNKKSTAIETLKKFTTDDAGNPLAVYALLGLGSKYDAMGDRKEAQAVFERIVNEFASSEAAPLAQVRLGDLLWAAGKADEARKAYEDLAVKFPDAAEYQTISQNRLGWIAASLPTKEVEPPPAPKAAPKPVVGPKPAGAATTPAMPGLKLNAGKGSPSGPISVPRLPPPPAPAPAIPSPLPPPGTPPAGMPAPKPAPGVLPSAVPAPASVVVPPPAPPPAATLPAPTSPPSAPATPTPITAPPK